MFTSLVAATEPAGGAALDQVVIATVGAGLVTALILWLIAGYRSGDRPHLAAVAATAERLSGLPSWAALPTAVSAVSLQVALLGMYWDIALHIDEGRDAGPLANPAHYLILVGLYGVFAAGILALALPRAGERPGPAPLKIGPDWYAPVGGVLIAACGAFALVGFPLDDLWHRLFGQDVTLWGPTHLMLIGGAGMTLVGQAVLLMEGMRSRTAAASQRASRVVALRRVALMGGLLIGLSTFQAEFDFGVPQFRLVFQPMLIGLAAGVALVAARLWVGRGGALAAVGFFLLLRGVVSLFTGPVFGQTTPSMPLYVVEALCVEAAALVLARRPLALGAVSGVLIGTVGFAGEWAWTQVGMRLPWTPDLLPEGIVYAVVAAVAGGLVGALLGLGLLGRLPRPALARAIPASALLAVGILTATGLLTSTPDGARATIELREVPGGDGRQGIATVRLDPPSLGDDPAWLTVTAWQGGGLDVAKLEELSPGVFRTTEPVPLHGDWKTLVRLHGGDQLAASAVYFPRDEAIPAPAIPAEPSVTRPFVEEVDLLQRERKGDVAGWLWATAGAVVLLLYVTFLSALAWGVGRVARRDGDGDDPAAPAPPQRVERFVRPVPTQAA
jgi:hypothetical protein